MFCDPAVTCACWWSSCIPCQRQDRLIYDKECNPPSIVVVLLLHSWELCHVNAVAWGQDTGLVKQHHHDTHVTALHQLMLYAYHADASCVSHAFFAASQFSHSIGSKAAQCLLLNNLCGLSTWVVAQLWCKQHKHVIHMTHGQQNFCLLAASLGSGPGSTMHFAFENDLSVCCCVTFAGVTQSTWRSRYYTAGKLPCDAESVAVFQYCDFECWSKA